MLGSFVVLSESQTPPPSDEGIIERQARDYGQIYINRKLLITNCLLLSGRLLIFLGQTRLRPCCPLQ